MATLLKTTYKLLLYSLIHQLNGNNFGTPAPACNIPHISPGCANKICEMQVCKINPQCCTDSWHESCVNIACDINNGICNNILGSCLFEAPVPPRQLLQTLCTHDPCPGNQLRNPTTCQCECTHNTPTSNPCPGNQIFNNVLCECGCATAPTCSTPKLFNTITCQCQCPTTTTSQCSPNQQFNAVTCKCTTVTNCSPTLDPCPGMQQRNEITCNCECDNIDFYCPGNQQFNQVSCDCQCPITPTCSSPKQFNPNSCQCECDTDMQCGLLQILNMDTCTCENDAETCSNFAHPCPGGIQIRNPVNCECECANNNQECDGNQEFNILCECQCGTTPICKAFQQFNDINCECECIAPPVCNPNIQMLDLETCECMTPVSNCLNAAEPCPGNQLRNLQTCNCECNGEIDAMVQQCPGNQEFNVFCECGCAVTPICTSLQQFDDILCECLCMEELLCDVMELFDRNTCMCVVTKEPTTAMPSTSNPTFSPSKLPTSTPVTANPTTNNPTMLPTNNPTEFPTNDPSISPTMFPVTSSPTTDIPTTQIPTVVPSNVPSNNPTNNPSELPSTLPSFEPIATNNPTELPSITPTLNPSKAVIYPYSETFICELTPATNPNNLVLDELWAMQLIRTLIHFADGIISSTKINIINTFSMDGVNIVIEYELEMDRLELVDIITDHIESMKFVIVNQQIFNIISNEIITTTTTDEPESTEVHYPFKKILILRLEGEYESLLKYLNGENIDIYSWAKTAVESLIHYDGIVAAETNIVINNIISSSIGVEYTLEMRRIEIFDIILNNIEATLTTQILIVGNHMFNLISNEIITKCGHIGEECNSIIKCCDVDGVICIAENANINNNVEHGICCIDYNNNGCGSDNDCCYDNSYCDNQGKCRRISLKRDEIDGDGKFVDNAKKKEEQLLDNFESYDMDTNEYIVLSPSVKIAVCFVVIIVIFVNVMCCIWAKWKKLKKEKSANKSVDNII